MLNPRAMRIDVHLTNLLIGYRNLGYIADDIFPILEVAQQSGFIPRFKRSSWFRSAAHLRGPGTASRGGSWEPDSNLEYFCPRVSFRDELPDEIVDASGDIFALEQTSVEFVGNMLQLYREINFATNFFTTGVWTDDQVGGTDFNQWNDLADSSPLIDMVTYIDAGEARIGVEPAHAVMGKQVWNTIRWHPDLLETIKYTQRGVVTQELARELFGLEQILVGRALKTDSPEGTAENDVVYDRIWGKHVLLYYRVPAPAINRPAAGYTLVWNRVPNALQWIKRMRNEEKEIDIIEANSYFKQMQTAPLAGQFFQNVVA